ncbi:MAG TPA: ROK family protein [Caulobacteraceae bacterium]|jgi:fructokinase
MTSVKPLLAGVELGGTKCVCVVGTGPDDIRTQISIPTGDDPEATLRRIEEILRDLSRALGPFAALGVASFGPVDLTAGSATYGFITSTAKPGWRNTDVAGRLGRLFDLPVGFDTDVNGAALAEGRWGAAQGLSDFAYVTVGTGVGVGLVVGGRPAHGFSHAELGHIRVARKAGDTWEGACPFHGDCVEGLASGAAIEQRLGVRAGRLAAEDPVWELVAHALGQLLHTLVLATAPRRILLGGGVMNAQTHMFERLRRELQLSLNHYVDAPEIGEGIADYVRPPGLGDLAGPLGALAIAADALASAKTRVLSA